MLGPRAEAFPGGQGGTVGVFRGAGRVKSCLDVCPGGRPRRLGVHSSHSLGRWRLPCRRIHSLIYLAPEHSWEAEVPLCSLTGNLSHSIPGSSSRRPGRQ